MVLLHNTVKINVAVNGSGNLWKDGEDVEDIFQCILVILILWDTIG